MLALGRLCILLAVLALVPGTPAGASCAGGMADTGVHHVAAATGVGHMLGGCPDCESGAAGACAEMACGVIATLPRGLALPASAPNAFAAAPQDVGAGLPGATDPPPPRTFVVR